MTERIGIWGASGSGKSTFAKQLVKPRRRIVIFDPLEEYGGQVNRGDVDLVRQAMRADWHGFKVSYVPPSGQEPRALSTLCRLLLKAQEPFKAGQSKAGITLVVEELNLSFPVHGGAAKSPGFAEVCSRGRHYGIEVIGISQRISEVDTRFRGNCSQTVVFRQRGAADVKAAKQELGEGATVPRDNFEYVTESRGQITGPTKLKKPRNR